MKSIQKKSKADNKNLLVVDDNQRYSKLLDEFFTKHSYKVEHADTGESGLAAIESKGLDYYRVLVTDITMENQIAGLLMLRKLKQKDYHGTVVVASTGFDVPGVTTLSRMSLFLFGVHYIIPKASVLNKAPIFFPMGFSKGPLKELREIR